MISIRSTAISFIFLTVLASVAFAQAPSLGDVPISPGDATAGEKPEARISRLLKEKWQVRVDLLMVSVPQGAALELLPSLRDGAKIDGACKRLEEMIARKEAQLIAWPEVVTKNGERAVTEGILEERYPTEFDPPQSPEESRNLPKPHVPKAVPTAFETRNTGASLEVEPVVTSDGASVLLSLVPQHVRLVEMKTHFTGKNSAGEELRIQQPEFRTMKTTTTLRLRSGQRQLLATFNNEVDGSLAFFIVRATVLPEAVK
jgi:hypothetical protein